MELASSSAVVLILVSRLKKYRNTIISFKHLVNYGTLRF